MDRQDQENAKLRSVVANLQRMWECNPYYGLIERVALSELTRYDWYQKYVATCRPVIVTDFLTPIDAGNWKLDVLKYLYAEEQVQVQANRDSNPFFEQEKHKHTATMRFGDFVDAITSEPTNNWYLTANNELLKRAPFTELIPRIQTIPHLLDRNQLYASTFLWIGGEGIKTPCHHDTVMLFHYQVQGRKKWRFVSPLELLKMQNTNAVFSPLDLADLTLPVRVIECTVEEGEAIFLPLAWWHQVESLDVSVSISFSGLPISNSYEYFSPYAG